MGKIGTIFIGILSIFLLLGAFRTPISDGIKGWRTTDSTQAFAVTTAAGVTSANVTLSYDLYQAATAEVIGITSNVTADVPVATTYTEVTKVLLVSGLEESKTHTLSVEYYAETDDEVMRVLGPFLNFLIFGGVTFGIIAVMWIDLKRRY